MEKIINHTFFAKESAVITLLCLMIAGIFKWIGLSNPDLLVIFTMAVMTSAGIYPAYEKSLFRIFGTSFLIIISIVAGGFLGKFNLMLGELIALIYVGFSFYWPRSRENSGLLVTSSMMFVIFLFFPASLSESKIYLTNGLMVPVIFLVVYFLYFKIFSMEPKQAKKKTEDHNHETDEIDHRKTRAFVGVTSIFLGFLVIFLLEKYTKLDHISWVALTIMMVIQGSHQKTSLTCLKRTGINALGAMIGVVLFIYVLPHIFWIDFVLLTALLFCIFCFGYSYFWRVLFIELFVLALAYVMGSFEAFTAWDRILLTAIGSGIVILVTAVISACEYGYKTLRGA